MKNTGGDSSHNIMVDFETWLVNQGKAGSTIRTYTAVLVKFEAWLKSIGKNLMNTTNDDVQSYMDYLEAQQKNPGTIEKYLAAISVYSRFTENPQLVVDIQRKEKADETDLPETLNTKEIKELLDHIEADGNQRNIVITYLLLHTGIRVSELCELNRSDIELEDGKGKLNVRHDGEIERVIPLSKEAISRLEQYLESTENQEDALFLSSVNKRISPRAIQYMLEKYNVNPHKLRHTFCRQLIKKGVDINTVAKLAGHRDVNVTKRYAVDLKLNLDDAIDQAFS
ncbi:tyrosine-type recombinase/integrase [Mesobacillus harenae]|uniref:tyrosine-type recombinase/integrase n=1 Tax=Mesobacillus harenae TaxID=2213203 RepID=UPI00157FFFA0